MKKILVMLGAMIISAGAAFSTTCDMQCAENPYENKTFISNIAGTNFLGEKIANIIIKKEILKDSSGDYKVDLQSYNISALARGEFKSLNIVGTNTVTDGIYASYIRLKTLCDYNYIEVNNKENTITFKENFGMAYAIQFTEDDLNQTMQNSSYMEMIRRVNGIGNASKMFNISSSSVKIKDNKLIYVMKVAIPLLNVKKEIAIETDVKARNGKIIINEAELMTEYFKIDAYKLSSLINYLNPLDFSMKLMKNKDANMQVKEIAIKDNKINVSGIVTVDKDVITEQ